MRRSIILLCALLLAVQLAAYDTGRKPMLAAGLSLVAPGGGQFYNGKYVKSAVVLGIEGWFLGSAIYHHIQMNEAYDKANNSTGNDYNHWASEYNQHYNSRQNAYWWLGTTIFLSILDAFVDAHLYNYEAEKQRIHLELEPDKVTISWRF